MKLLQRTGIMAGVVAMGVLLGLPAARAQETPTAPAAPSAATLLNRLPSVAPGQYAAALQAAKARGNRADVAWIELFYGDSAAKRAAALELQRTKADDSPEMAFVRFAAAYSRGQDHALLAAALQLMRTVPNDVATELAVRELSGQLEDQGRVLLNALPSLEHALREPLADPVTSYMLGRSVLAAVHGPGLALTQAEANQLAGRLPHWQLWGPFGDFSNLGFDRVFDIEKQMAASYPADFGPAVLAPLSRTPQAFTSTGDGVHFPLDWGRAGVEFAVTYVRAPEPMAVQIRLYAQASAQLEINGTTVLRNDRRSSYRPATATAALELAAGWNRVVVKLGGNAIGDFDLMLRPSRPGPAVEDAAQLPAGAQLAAAPRPLAAPETLAAWSRQRVASHPDDAVALWVDGVRKLQDEDAEGARVALQQAAKLAPNAALVWLDLSESYGNLNDASQSWAAAEVERTARQALAVAPEALRAYDRLGHVYESQGKPTQAAEQFAHCTGQGYADCDWSLFHLAAHQQWQSEAETALAHALAESGSDWDGIVSGLEFYAGVGDAAQATAWQRRLEEDPRAAAALGAYQLHHGEAGAAARSLAVAIAQNPSSASLHRERIEALLSAGDVAAAERAAQAALAEFPYDARLAAVAAQTALRQGAAQGISALRAHDAHRGELREQASFLAGEQFWAPWDHSAQAIIAQAPDATAYPSASAILVFDQMINRVNPDATQDQYIHQIYKVLNAAGVEQFAEVTSIPHGSDLIRLRTIKTDGESVLPENISNITDVTMPDLEPGDYIEIEFVQHMAASQVLPDTLDDNEFFVFNSSKLPYNYSDYVVLTPPQYPLLVDQERFPGAPTVRVLPDGYTARQWLVQKTRILVTEPNMPPETNLVPKVWISTPRQWDEISRYYADNTYDVRKTTLEMRQKAETLTAGKTTDVAKANAIFQWVGANIQPGPGTILSPARQYFTDRSGNRVAVFLGLLAAAHVPWQLVLARAVTDDSSIKIPSIFQFQYPLIHVAAGAEASDPASGWYDLNGDFAHLDYIAPGIRGGLALVAGAAGPGEFIHIPTFTSPLDGLVVTITGSVNDAGDATLHMLMAFRGPSGQQVRRELASLPASTLPQIYQQVLLASYPNATSTGGKLENRDARGKPLIFSIDATVPGFIQMNGTQAGSSWNIGHLTGAVGVLRRYAPLPFRNLPLVIPGDSFEQTNLTLTLPARFGKSNLPQAADIENTYGRFQSSFAQAGNTIEFHRTLFLKADRIAPADYGSFRAFARRVDAQDRLQLTGAIGH
ncbi:MAG: DUF3858 domain-containing protein [Terriglobales bacterium]